MTLKGVKAEDDRGREQRIVHVVHNDVLKAGDVVPSHIYIKQTFVVKEIKSSRPASGSWKCPRPTWYEVVIE